jgi:hypothetical protein
MTSPIFELSLVPMDQPSSDRPASAASGSNGILSDRSDKTPTTVHVAELGTEKKLYRVSGSSMVEVTLDKGDLETFNAHLRDLEAKYPSATKINLTHSFAHGPDGKQMIDREEISELVRFLRGQCDVDTTGWIVRKNGYKGDIQAPKALKGHSEDDRISTLLRHREEIDEVFPEILGKILDGEKVYQRWIKSRLLQEGMVYILDRKLQNMDINNPNYRSFVSLGRDLMNLDRFAIGVALSFPYSHASLTDEGMEELQEVMSIVRQMIETKESHSNSFRLFNKNSLTDKEKEYILDIAGMTLAYGAKSQNDLAVNYQNFMAKFGKSPKKDSLEERFITDAIFALEKGRDPRWETEPMLGFQEYFKDLSEQEQTEIKNELALLTNWIRGTVSDPDNEDKSMKEFIQMLDNEMQEPSFLALNAPQRDDTAFLSLLEDEDEDRKSDLD